jgi:hypothetical protein
LHTIPNIEQEGRLALLASVRAKVPAELRDRDQWVTWRYELRPGNDKPTKVPYNPVSHSKADSTDPNTWGTFEQACAAFTERDYDGIGYVFSEDDPYTGIDFDSCIVDGQIEPTKWGFVCQLDSYTERSPSGTGIHTIVRGVLPEGGRKSKKHGVEMYDQERFFTVTGQHICNTPTAIKNRQKALTALHAEIFGDRQPMPYQEVPDASHDIPADDAELLEQMFSSKHGEAIQRLWEGDISDYSDDDSSADLALCNHLAYWTNRDQERIDRLFRQSGLMREKWEREDYCNRTISKALEKIPQSSHERKPYFTFLSYDSFMQRPPKKWMIKNVVGEGDIVTIFGASGSAKTFTVIDLIFAASQGKDWVGRWDSDKQWHGKFEIARPLTVAYCFGEGGTGLPDRFRAAQQYYGRPVADIRFVPDVPQLYDSKSPSGMDAFIREHGQAHAAGQVPALDLLVIDTQATATLGADENSTKEMSIAMESAKKAIKALGCSVILIHHATKGGDVYRGSTVLHATPDCIIEVVSTQSERKIECFKLKDGEPWKPERFSLVSHSGVNSAYVSWDGTGTLFSKHLDQRQRKVDTIKQLLQGNPSQRFTASGVFKRTTISTTTSKRVLEKLANEGFANYEEKMRGEKTIGFWYFDPAKSG